MKSLAAVGLAIFFAACGLAQEHRSFGVVHFGTPQPAANTLGSGTGFGRVLFPGTGQQPTNGSTGFGRVLFPGTGAPPGTALSITDTTFASRLGATVSGLGNGGFDGRGRRFRQPLVFPYAYPVYVGGNGDYGYGDYGYPPEQPNNSYVNPPQQAPQVVINQNFVPERATPVVREYGEDSSGVVHVYEAPGRAPVETPAEDTTSYYLLAFKDHSIYSAFAYWVEGDTLHYVTPQRIHNQASLSLLDRELTDKLNRDRNLQVRVPR